jgi:antitoxin component YwqK of YwqJK toxin-antitoxin module
VYASDLPDGTFISYYSNGLMKREAIYSLGELKTEKLYNEEGARVKPSDKDE